jgi:hypothetical protein
VDDAAVVARLVPGDARFLLEDEQGRVRPAQQELAGGGQAENARADDDEVVRCLDVGKLALALLK